MNLALPSSIKGAAKAIGVFLLLGVGAAAATAALVAIASLAGMTSVAGAIQKYSPFRFGA